VDTSVVLPLQQREAQIEPVDANIDFVNSSRDIRNNISMEIGRNEPAPHHLVQGKSVTRTRIFPQKVSKSHMQEHMRKHQYPTLGIANLQAVLRSDTVTLLMLPLPAI
jgi:hypothetical protein